MYKTALPPRSLQLSVLDTSQLKHFMRDPRARFDFSTRMALLNAEPGQLVHVFFPIMTEVQRSYWDWFASTLRVRLIVTETDAPLPDYPDTRVPCGLFTSATPLLQGGVESTVGRELLYGGQLVNMQEANYDRQQVGMIEGFIAILGPAMGFGVTYIGDERYSGPEDRENDGEYFSDKYAIEQTESWWRMWNNYVGPRNTVMSLVGVWTKPELINKVASLGLMATTTSCFFPPESGGWCGDCWKCASIKMVLDNQGHDSSFIPATSAEYMERLKGEYTDFKNGIDPFRSTGMLTQVFEGDHKDE